MNPRLNPTNFRLLFGIAAVAVTLAALLALEARPVEALGSDSTLSVRARGSTGDELMSVQLTSDPRGSYVAQFEVTTDWQDYTTELPAGTPLVGFRVEFTNDLYEPPYDRNLFVDRITYRGVQHESEASTTYSLGAWQPGIGCRAGFKQTELLACGGYFQYERPADANDPPELRVRARGQTGDEVLEVELVESPEIALATIPVGTSWRDYFIALPVGGGPYRAADIRVSFVNDLVRDYGRYDRNLFVDHIELHGVVYESEAATTFSSGTWQPGVGCSEGYRRVEVLACDGFFQYERPQQPGDPRELRIRARGDTAFEAISVEVDDGLNTVAVALIPLSSSWADYYVPLPPGTELRDVTLVYEEFIWSPPNDPNVHVDFVELDGAIFEAEAPSTFSVGSWLSGVGCGEGFNQTETLYCSGYFRFDAA